MKSNQTCKIFIVAIILNYTALIAWAQKPDAEVPTVGTNDTQPNILLVIVDTLRPDHLGCYGYERTTSPNIDALAKRSVLFERVYSTSSWTLPACTSLLSGVYPHKHGATTWSSNINKQIPWLPEILKHNGYHTMGVSSNPFLTTSRGFDRGFDSFDDQTVLASAEWSFPLLKSRHKAMVLASTGATATRRAMEMLLDRPTDKPFFLMVHYMDCHADYVPPSPWDKAFDSDYTGEITGHVQSKQTPTSVSKRDLEHIVALYDGEVASVDAHVGQLLEQLNALGLEENTCIILTADHGEEFLEHGQWFHGHTVYEECIRVPMMIRWPGVSQEGCRVKEPVSLVDVMPTVVSELFPDNAKQYLNHASQSADVADQSYSVQVDGIGLNYSLRGVKAPTERWLLSETQLSRPLLSIVNQESKAVLEFSAPNQWDQMTVTKQFDLASDPNETNPHDIGADVIAAMTERLKKLTGQLTENESEGKVDQAQLERLRSLGYIGG